ncbi:MAG: glycosyltransferase family 39 protein [Patescibacteria group bacterium]|nr:glycosyltransferase family 39 protein [Patescibacteria group bacterium]
MKLLRKQDGINPYLFLLFFLALFHFFGNLTWIFLNENPLDFDPLGHTLLVLNMFEYLKDNFYDFNLGEFMRISPAYPNFSHLSTLPLVFFFGNHWKIVQFSGTIFFILSILAIFFYVREISESNKLSFFTVFFYSFFISILRYSRLFTLDIPLITLIFLTLFFWERFKKKGNLALLYLGFFSAGLAQLTKWHAVIFLFIPFVFIVIFFIRNNPRLNLKISLSKLLLGGMIFFILAFPWYFYNFSSFIRLGTINYAGEPDDPQRLLSFENLFFYLRLIALYQTHFLVFIFFVISLFIIPYKKKDYLKIPILSFLFCYFFFTFFVVNKNIRVIFPMMPLIALILAEGFCILLKKNAFIASVISFFIVFAYFILSFGFPIEPNFKYVLRLPFGSSKEDFEHNIGQLELIYLHTYPINLLYDRNKIDYREINDKLFSLKKTIDSPLRVLVGLHLLNFYKDHLIIDLYMKYSSDISFANRILYDERYRKIELLGIDYLRGESEKAYFEKLKDVDVIITAQNNPIQKERTIDVLYGPVKILQRYLKENQDPRFILFDSVSLGGHDSILFFGNKSSLYIETK